VIGGPPRLTDIIFVDTDRTGPLPSSSGICCSANLQRSATIAETDLNRVTVNFRCLTTASGWRGTAFAEGAPMSFASRTAWRPASIVLACLFVLVILSSAFAQDKPAVGTAGTMSPDEKAMMDAMMKAATPGANHEMLASIAGDWTFKNRMWMNPAAPPTESTGTVTYTTLLGGRYVQGQYRGDMMGTPFEGVGLMGYNNTSQRFEATWVDNMDTMIMYMTGQYDAATKTLTYTGQMDDPVKPGTTVKVREVVRLVSPDAHVMEWYETRNGKEVKTMEVTYNRAK
jgi:hypothetical protein